MEESVKQLAKKKACELYGNYAQVLRNNTDPKKRTSEITKACAMVSVDEILNEPKFKFTQDHHFDFWKEVKSQLEAL